MKTSEFMERTGLTRYQVKNWQEAGYIRPVNAPKGLLGPGHGTPLEWSEEAAERAAAMLVLARSGLALQAAHDAAWALVEARQESPRAQSHTVPLSSRVSVTVKR